MTPWKSKIFLSTVNDYLYYEFWCKENLFQPIERVRCLDIIVKPGYVVYIPPYWFYSIEFQDNENEVCMVKYTTGANLLANIKHIGLYNLQKQNKVKPKTLPLHPQFLANIFECYSKN
jgi:hypothetical protein